jgi:DNA-binding transcriptional ArsR family regulator
LRPITPEKRDTILKLQEAVGRSPKKLRIIKNVNKRESIAELQKRLKIPQPTISKAMTRFETYGLVKLIKKKGKSEVYDRTAMLKQIGNIDSWIGVELEQQKEPMKSRKLKVKLHTPSAIPYLDSKADEEAEKMAEPYVLLYLFENSLRAFINKVMGDKHGQDWWTKVGINATIINKVEGRKKLEGINKWHVPRGAHEIYYADLEDLTYFLRKEPEFAKYLDIGLWDTMIDKVLKLSRNIVDHHNPLPQREIDRLKTMLEDWKRQLK